MKQVKVYPDYCSSGLWDCNGANMGESEFEGVVGELSLLALKYWHYAWEYFANDDYRDDGNYNGSLSYRNEWYEDGKKIVKQMNEEQDVYDFIYAVTDSDYTNDNEI